MSLKEADYKREDSMRATVTLECDDDPPTAIEMLGSPRARQFALQVAEQHGLRSPGISVGGSGAYPVTLDGEKVAGPVLPPGGCRYRCDYPINGGTP